jgi:hypothetical protein
VALSRATCRPANAGDWTEGALIGLHFALKHEEPIIWMLNPLDLNDLASGKLNDFALSPDPSGNLSDPSVMREFPLTWLQVPGFINPAYQNINGAWTRDLVGVRFPVAVYPTYVHARLRAQRACCTIHGSQKKGLDSLLPESMLKRYAIDPTCRPTMLQELRLLGVTE